MRYEDHQDSALVVTICVVGGALLMGGWFLWEVVVPRFMEAVTAALN
jgi:hypothetical protein